MLVVNPRLPAKTMAEFIAHAKANPGKVGVRLVRRAHRQPPVAIELIKIVDRHRRRACALSGRRADADRHDRRPHPGRHRRAAELAAAYPQRRGPRRSRCCRRRGRRRCRTCRRSARPSRASRSHAGRHRRAQGHARPRSSIISTARSTLSSPIPSCKKRYADVGPVPLIITPAQAKARIARDIDKWAKVVKDAGIKPE